MAGGRLGGHKGAPQGQKRRPTLKADLNTAMQRIGELTMENELLWVRVRRPGPLAKRRSKTLFMLP